MPTRDGFNQGHPLPLLLADEPDEQGVEKAWGRAAISSPTKDGFNLLLLFLSDGPEQQGIGKAWDRAAISSPTKDGFNQGHPLPPFLADGPEQQGIGKAWDRAVISSRVLSASILVATATNRRFSLPPISRRQQFNLPPMLWLCRRPQRTRRPATKLLQPLNPPARFRRKRVSRHLKLY
jgi:hypothetical protein